jgi:hypothetical protein
VSLDAALAIVLVTLLVVCAIVSLVKRDAPRRNRRVRLPKPFTDDRSSLEVHRRMYPK